MDESIDINSSGAITWVDYDWDSRINSLVNMLMYEQEIDPNTTNRYELEAAKLIIKWQANAEV